MLSMGRQYRAFTSSESKSGRGRIRRNQGEDTVPRERRRSSAELRGAFALGHTHTLTHPAQSCSSDSHPVRVGVEFLALAKAMNCKIKMKSGSIRAEIANKEMRDCAKMRLNIHYAPSGALDVTRTEDVPKSAICYRVDGDARG